MTEPQKDAYVKLIYRLGEASEKRTGLFKRPSPDKELLEDAYEVLND